MAFTPTQSFSDCSTLGLTQGRATCENVVKAEQRLEQMLNHYFENGDENSYFAPLNGSLQTLDASVGVVNDNVLLQYDLTESMKADFAQFWVLFQVMILAMVIVFVGKWFWKLIAP